MVGPSARRVAACHLQEKFGVSERRSCVVLGQHRSVQRRPKIRCDTPLGLESALRRIASSEPSWGYRSILRALWIEGLPFSERQVRKSYKALGLARKRKQKRRLKVTARQPMTLPTRRNEVWAIDFISDRTERGTPFRVFAALDVASRESLTLKPRRSLPARAVTRILNRAISENECPKAISCDNGPEFRSKHFQTWAARRGIDIQFIEPGKPMQNAFFESESGRFRDEFLNTHFFASLDAAKELIEEWRHKYNNRRGHSRIGGMPPAKYALTLEVAA